VTFAAPWRKADPPNLRATAAHWSQIEDYFTLLNCVANSGGDLSNLRKQQAAQIESTVQRYPKSI
jgi:hypothetical protein